MPETTKPQTTESSAGANKSGPETKQPNPAQPLPEIAERLTLGIANSEVPGLKSELEAVADSLETAKTQKTENQPAAKP